VACLLFRRLRIQLLKDPTMKNMVILLLVISFSYPTMAKDKTLFSSEIESGWYGGASFKVGTIMDETGYFAGLQGGWIINHRFVLGGKGYMLVNPVEVEGLQNIEVGFGYGGILLEYLFTSNHLLHVTVESVIGLGGVYNDIKDYSEYHDPLDYTGDACFVAEPGINMMLRVTRKFRIGVGASYRYVNGIDYDAGKSSVPRVDYDLISDSDLTGMSAQIIIKFGSF
jgi:hypothetical protein